MAIPMQEKRGQQDLVKSAKLPIKGSESPEAQASPIKWGPPVANDDLFREATLPEGWKKAGTDHDMWSDILDDQGRVRAKVFYKAAFYDRRAHIDFERRYYVTTDYSEEAYAKIDREVTVLVMDNGVVPPAPLRKETFAVPSREGDSRAHYAAVEGHTKAFKDWLAEKFPNFMDPNAYWDDAPGRYEQILENDATSV